MASLARLFRKHDAPAAAPAEKAAASGAAILIPLAAAQFLASYDTQSMSVAISAIVEDLDTTVTGVQTAMSLFTLTMAALMIPGSKLTDIWGRKRCFTLGLTIYAIGALTTSVAPVLGVMIVGYSVLEGIGSALMIPPIYILVTVLVTDGARRAKAFGVVSAAAALGAATGPLLGGLITTAITWRASFLLEVVAIVAILYMSRRIPESPLPEPRPKLDILGSVLSAAALVSIILGLLQAGDYGWLRARKDFAIGDTVLLQQGDISPVVILVAIGLGLLLLFGLHILRSEKKGNEPLIPSRLFRSRVTNLGLITQNAQWFLMIGTTFVVSVFLQVSRGYSAIETGLVLTPATAGILLASFRIAIMLRKFSERAVIRAGFVTALVGIVLFMLLANNGSSALLFAPGLFFIGLGCGAMLTASVNVVQSSVQADDQGGLSGLSRSVSNLGSSMGTAVAGAVLISALVSGLGDLTNESTVLSDSEKQTIGVALEGSVSAVSDQQVEEALQGQSQPVVDEVVRINAEARDRALGFALVTVAVFSIVGLAAAIFLPGTKVDRTEAAAAPPAAPT